MSPPTSPSDSTPGSRDKILDVAEALFARRGFAGVGLREVAETAGFGKSSLFHHFTGKVELYFAVTARVLERIEERVSPALAGDEPVVERLDRGVDALVDALAEHPATARLLLRGIFEDDDFGPEPPEAQAFEERVNSIIGALRALLREGVEAGVFHAVSASHMAQTLIGATVYHFASGEFGESLIGEPLLSASAVARRKAELRSLLHHGLVRAPETASSEGD